MYGIDTFRFCIEHALAVIQILIQSLSGGSPVLDTRVVTMSKAWIEIHGAYVCMGTQI